MARADADALTGYSIAVVSIAVAVAARLLLDPVLDTRFPFMTFLLAVLLSARVGGLGPALLASVLGAVSAAWFLPPPRHTLPLNHMETVGGLTLYLAVSIGIAFIASAMQRARQDAEANAADVTAQREKLRVTLESIGDAVITTDMRGCITSMNSVACHMTGWSSEEALGRPLEEVFHIVNEENRQVASNPVRAALADGRVVGLANHTLLLGRDGIERPIDDSAAPIRDGHGAILGVVLVFRDVTESRRAAQQVRSSEQELSDFFETANVGMHFAGPDGSIVRANQAELDLLGFTHDEYVGRRFADFHVDPEEGAELLRRLAAGETLQHFPARLRGKDGSIKEVVMNCSPRWEQGRLVHSRCFTLDVTASRRGEEAQALLAAVVESSEDAIVTKKLDGTITSWNKGAERLYGYSADEVAGKSIYLIIPPERHSEERSILARLVAGERVQHFETVRRAKDGRLLDVSLSISPVRDASGRIIGASKVARDITERKRAEEALRQADRRKDEFLATLAHELRNPLAPIRNSLEIMKMANGDSSRLAQAQMILDRQAAHLERLVDDLLDIARITRDRLELRRLELDLASIIDHAVETCRPLAQASRVDLEVAVPEEPIYILGDTVRLSQVFTNLLNNACKYTEPGGRVWITVRREGDDAVVSVRDTGLGIPPEMLGSIFDMFVQVDQPGVHARGGLGIGLTLARRLVEMHGGSMEARSEGLGRGSEFVVRLPMLTDGPGIAAHPLKVQSAPRRRILVVDDNTDSAESLATLLQMTGHDIQLAHDGAEALEVAKQFRPDVVLLDIGLPTMSGHDAARRIRAEPWGRQILLVALTGWGQDEDRRKSKEVGFDHHLVKPVDIPALMRLLALPLAGAA